MLNKLFNLMADAGFSGTRLEDDRFETAEFTKEYTSYGISDAITCVVSVMPSGALTGGFFMTRKWCERAKSVTEYKKLSMSLGERVRSYERPFVDETAESLMEKFIQYYRQNT